MGINLNLDDPSLFLEGVEGLILYFYSLRDGVDHLGLLDSPVFGVVVHPPEDNFVVVRDDVPDGLVVVEFLLVVAPALFGIPGAHPLGHLVEDLVLLAAGLALHDLQVFLEELDVFNLLLAGPLALPSLLLEERLHVDFVLGVMDVVHISLLQADYLLCFGELLEFDGVGTLV